MGTVPHHQAKAHEFLNRADCAIAAHDPLIPSRSKDSLIPSSSKEEEAAAALCRAASHIITALAVHYGCKHNSRPRLEFVLHAAIADDCLTRSHLQTFRQIYTLPQHLATLLAHPEPVEGRAAGPIESNHPANPMQRCKYELRRMRRRVAALIASVNGILRGEPKPLRYNKLWQRRPDLPTAPNFTHVRDVTTLPNYLDIRERFRLHQIGLAAVPDPHGWYDRGEQPRRCPCHSDLWREPKREPSHITLSPLWRKALEKTFRIKLPDNHQLIWN